MRKFTALLFPWAFALMGSGISYGASISLDTVGSDPALTSPSFTFMTDQTGGYAATYQNLSNPPFDFVSLELTAPFSSGFYFGPAGPKTLGATCDGGRAFTSCSITFYDRRTTLVFNFFGLDSTHLGFPYQRQVGLVADFFEPNQTIGATAAIAPVSTPEPGGFQLAAMGIALCGLIVSGKKFLKIRVRP